MHLPAVAALCTVLLPLAAAEGHGSTPFMLRAGICTPSPSLREAIDGPWGGSLGAGWLLGEQGLIGAPSIDGDLRAHLGGSGSQTVLDLTYAERAMIAREELWFGGGLGLAGIRYNPDGPGGSDYLLAPAGKALLGGWVDEGFFWEASFTIEGRMDDDAVSAAVGLWVGRWF
jgi:hypothetical protein